ncbi:MAG: DNA translocase FtsK [Spirochaetia bacterium]
MRVRIALGVTAVFLVIAATYTTVALLFTALEASGLPSFFAVPGRFLFASFRYAGFYLPVYLFLCAFLLMLPSLNRRFLLAGTLGIVPFLTASVVFQLVSGELGTAARTAAEAFGAKPAGIIFFLLTLGEIAAIYALMSLFYRESKPLSKLRRKLLPPPMEHEVEEKRTGGEERRGRFPSITGGIRFPEMAAVEETERTGEVEDFAELEEVEKADEIEEVDLGEIKIAEQGEEHNEEDFEYPEYEDNRDKPLPPPSSNVWNESGEYRVPEEELLHDYPDNHYWVIDDETRNAAEILKTTLEEFKISAEVTGIQKGPVITMFEILPAPGVKLSKIVNLADNIALRLAASRVRIVAPIPGKHAVGIEVPNRKRSLVGFREMLQSEEFVETDNEIPIILGKDITGVTQLVDLVQTPHLLIAGATGSGKSVCVNSIICSILYKRSPQEVRLMLIDPKIVELKLYNDIPHLLTPVITEPKRAFQALQYCLYEMERRYSLLDNMGVRDIQSYNHKVKKRRLANEPLPYIVVVVDEFADLMATSGKELESTLARLAAMSRAVGIHLVLATQRPSIDVITGLIKANIPSRIAFMVASKFDSRIIIDAVGAEKLLGKGDMLFTSAWNPHPTRIQGSFMAEEEVERVTEYMRSLGEPDYIDEEIFFVEDEEEEDDLFGGEMNDPLIEKAVEVVATANKASASYLQRRLKIGYNRAARLVEEMEMRGIVGPQNGSKPRDILQIPDEYRETAGYK